MQEKRIIDLKVPKSWRACSAKDLEELVEAKLEGGTVLSVDDDNMAWKTKALLRLANLEVVDVPEVKEGEDMYLLVEWKQPKRSLLQRLLHREKKKPPFPLYSWQLHDAIRNNLSWLDREPDIVKFPYPTWVMKGKEFRGPGTFLSDWTWTQYQLVQDYMQYILKVTDMAAKMTKNKIHLREQRKLSQQLQTARAMLLATIYVQEVDYMDAETNLPKRGWRFVSGQSEDNSKYFQEFPEMQFQVVLLWWSSMMTYLHRTYPKCFSTKNEKRKTKDKRPTDPTILYARLTATMEKYMGTDEQTLGKENFKVVLQHLNDMVQHNEELERMKRK